MNHLYKKLGKSLIDLPQWEFEFLQRGEQPILLSDFFCRSLSNYMLQWMTDSKEMFNSLFTDTNKGYHNPKQRALIFEALKKKLKNPKFVHKFLRTSVEFPEKFALNAHKINKELKDPDVTNKKLATFWKTMDEGFIKLIPWFYYPWYVSKENMLTDKVKSGLERYRSKIEKISDFDETLMLLVFPIKKTAFQLEQADMLRLVLMAEKSDAFEKSPAFKKEANRYLSKYDWMTTFILMPLLPMTFDELVRRVRQAQKEKFSENLKIQQLALENNRKLAKKIIALFKDDKKLLLQIKQAQELGYALTAGIEEGYRSSSLYMDLMQAVAKRIGIPFIDMKFLLSGEIHNALLKDQQIPKIQIEERKAGYAMMCHEGQQYVAFGKTGRMISEWIDAKLNNVETDVSLIKGQCACKGLVKGKVFVVRTPAESHKLKEGEILVCSMTNPDYVSAMRRSGAIITDEGGLLSHAAIMSREFKKPCVIATKIATRVLRNGDVVEVDAEKGVVRILKRAK